MRLAVVVLAGCGRIGFQPSGDVVNTGAVVGAVDGSRLHAERWVTSDGVAQFARWYDTLLDTPCAWNGTDGARCLPTSAANDGRFADASCTIPAVRGTPDWAPKFASSASAPKTIFAVGTTPVAAYMVSGTTCVPSTDGTYYPLGAAVPDAMFTAGHSEKTPIGDGLSLVELVGDDGSRFTFDLATSADGMACDVMPPSLSATTALCVPRVGLDLAVFAREYLDAACSREAVESAAGSASTTVTYANEPCSPTRTVELGPLQPTASIYVRDVTGACVRDSNRPAAAITDFGPGLVSLAAVDVAAGARLRAQAWRTPGGALISRGLYDTTLHTSCTPETDADRGRTYCVMPNNALNGFTASLSSACTQPPVTIYASCSGVTMPVSGSWADEDRTGRTYHFLTFGELVAPPVSLSDSNVCMPVNTAGATLYLQGTYVPYDPSGLAEMTLTRD